MNLQNDVVAILDASGTQVVKYAYDAWGRVISVTGSLASTVGAVNPIRYRSYYYDTETGLYFLNSRYYDPEICRFLSADDAEMSGAVPENILQYNLFSYCFNNPVNLVDDDGGWPSWATKVAIGTGVIAVAAVLTLATGGAAAPAAVAAVHCFAVGALEGAVTGALMGTLSGAAMGAVTYRLTTGSWEGASNAALEGAASGYMSGAITGFISGGVTSSYCFVSGTAVLSSSGLVAIETICAGDTVYAWNEATGETELKAVVETYINETDELVHVFVEGEEIVSTPAHPYFSPVKGWTDAAELRAGDILVLVNGAYVVVEKVQHEILEAPVKVYNFQVSDDHTYYVSGIAVLVHNACGRGGKQAKLRELANDDKLSSALRGEIKRDMNAIARGQRKTIRVPNGYNLAHEIGYSAKDGFNYGYSVLQPAAMHRLHHHVFGYR